MWWSAEKLRWSLVGGVVLLAGVLAALFGLANYRAGKVWHRILARNGVNLHRETNGVTYSQSVKGRTEFTLHAAKTVPHGPGSWSMQDAVLILYGKNNQADRIYGSQFEYDETHGIVRALGEVHLDLQAPLAGPGTARQPQPGISFVPGDDAAEDPGVIHVRTSGLVYVRSLGTAATDQPTEFHYKGLTCTSRGAQFDSNHSVIHLPADVRITGELRGKGFTLTATRADLDRSGQTTNLSDPALVSADRSAHAEHAVLHLRPGGSLQEAEASGGVETRSGTQTLSAPQMTAQFGTENKLQGVLLSGGVRLQDANAKRPEEGSAGSVQLTTDGEGLLSTALAEGGASLTVKEMATDGPPAIRQLHSQKVMASFVAANGARRSSLRVLHITGGAEIAAETPSREAGKPAAATRVDGDDLTLTFAPDGTGKPEPQRMVGTGRTELAQTASDGGHQTSSADALDMHFTKAGEANRGAARLNVASAVQTGHVILHATPHPTRDPEQGSDEGVESTGRAQRAVFDGSAGTLTLTSPAEGLAELDNGQTQLRAAAVVLHQDTGDGEASGGVSVTTASAQGSPATHIRAGRAELSHSANMSRFFGSDADPVQLWQAGSQIQAAEIVLDGGRHTLSARPGAPSGAVHAVFATQKGAGAAAPEGHAGRSSQSKFGPNVTEASRDAVRVTAAAMDYNDAEREAIFNGRVHLEGAQTEVTGQRGAAFLRPGGGAGFSAGKRAPASGSKTAPAAGDGVNLGGGLDRILVLGDVRLQQQGRSGAGEQLTYSADTDSFVLTGTPASPPRIHDPQQGLVTGTTLVFGAADSSIVVAGAQAGPKQPKPTRVHTETDLKRQ